MEYYTVKQIANIFKTNEETVRRWIRSGKLVATQTSKKNGNIISSDALAAFVKKMPKYAPIVAASLATSSMAFSILLGGVVGGVLSIMEKKNKVVESSDVEKFIKDEIVKKEKLLRTKQIELEKLEKEIALEKQTLNEYKYALKNLDLEVVAIEVNNRKSL